MNVNPMTGESLLQALLALTPEQRKLPVLARDHEWWYYDMSSLELKSVDEGVENEDEENPTPNCIALT